MKLVYGVGYNDGKYPARIGKEKTLEYKYWQKMLMRCYDSSSKFNSSYVDCSVSENFKNYSYFYEWCQNQVGFGIDGFQLDKDLMIKGNKVYSEDSCSFVPREVNNIFVSVKSRRGSCPIGVSFDKRVGKFEAYCHVYGKRKHLGFYADKELAFLEYKKCKEWYVKIIAEKHKNNIDVRVYKSLMNWSIDIDD